MKYSFTVPGKPKGKARPRFNACTGRTYTPKATQDYEADIRACYLQAKGKRLSGAICVTVCCFYEIAKSHTKATKQLMENGGIPATIKPDLDNVGKAVLDALNGIAFDDDKQVVDLRLSKSYSIAPRLEIEVMEV